MSDVDAVVLDLDGGASLETLVRSLEAQTVRPRRVVVWDNGSAVPVSARLTSTLPLHILRSETNLGFTGGVNGAMRDVDAPFVAWVNNDVVLDPRWLATLRARFSEPGLAAVQAIQLSSDGATIDGAGVAIDDGTFRQRGHGLPAGSPVAEPFWGVSATAAMYRVAALRSVALGDDVLDPSLFAWYEDVELDARLLAAGWRMALVEEPLAIHAGSQTAPAVPFAAALRTRNRYRVARKHPGVGRLSALLWEDARTAIRNPRHLATIVRAAGGRGGGK